MLRTKKRKLLFSLSCIAVVTLHGLAFWTQGVQIWDDGRWVGTLLLIAVLLYLRGRLGLGASSDLATFSAYEDVPSSIPMADFVAAFFTFVAIVKLLMFL